MVKDIILNFTTEKLLMFALMYVVVMNAYVALNVCILFLENDIVSERGNTKFSRYLKSMYCEYPESVLYRRLHNDSA